MSVLGRSFPLGGAFLLSAVGLTASLAAGPGPSPSPAPSPAPAVSPSPKPGQAAPVYTEEDLKKAGGRVNRLQASPGPGTSSASEGDSESASGGEGSEGNEGKAREQEWRERFAAQRKEIADAEAKVKELEAKITALNLDADPSPPDLMDPNRMQKREAALQAATADLAKARGQVVALRQGLSDLEEEARRAFVPAGWTRE